MKPIKKKPLTKKQTREQQKGRRSKSRGKPVTAKPKSRRAALKKPARGKTAPVKKDVIVPLKKLYITISGDKVCLDNEIIKKYHLKAGDFLPFSRHKVFAEK